ncbi:MAG TPA: CocE/NonD family hydrolase [Solirubrobacteraceae bacterium]|nr:CocE/NonD family hydrolase [Solirubrobacteraceae bacterium]
MRALNRLAVVVLLACLGTLVPAAVAAARVTAHGSTEQVYATGLKPHARTDLLNAKGHVVARLRADAQGGVVFTGVKPGAGYRVRLGSSGDESASLTVHSEAAKPWDPSVYDQRIKDNGYQYLTTRDGTRLAIDVHPPSHPAGISALPDGVSLPSSYSRTPYPTVIEYAGYGYADPAGPDSGIAVLANLMGFAVVDVNMRGTGCSGGDFNYFEPQQNLDAYDVIQTIAHQPWVLDHKVGMIGVSYGAISQLFAAQLDPPALEAISPLSTIDSTVTTLYPGGILNTGFAVAWAAERQHDAEPAGPNSGQSWAYKRIQQGDGTCRSNQALHGEAPSVLKLIHDNAHYIPKMADPLDPVTFVHKIKVPVFLACQWEDEQTGGHCADLAQDFTGTSHKWFTFTNGAHIDSLDPATFDRWYDFLSLFVAHQAPIDNLGLVEVAAPFFYGEAMAINNLALPYDPIQHIASYQAALAAYEQLPSVRVLFDNGAGAASTGGTVTPGDPYPAFEQSFPSFPIPGTVAQTWYLGTGGSLATSPAQTSEVDGFTWNPKALPATDYASANTETGGLWGNAADWDWNWQQNPAGTAVSYVSQPLTQNTTVIGGGAVHLWIKASAPNVDLQATVSEVDSDGDETFVQDGWVRADERKLAPGSTLLEPLPNLRSNAVQPLPSGKFVEVTIPLYYEGHVYRAGSRIRVTIAAPGGAEPLWAFAQTNPSGTAGVSVRFSSAMPSNLVLPVVPGVSVPTGLPPCPSLRNEPCRTYVPYTNQTGS